MPSTTTHTALRVALAALLVGAVAALAGCRGERSENPPRQFFPDMDDSPRWNPQAETEFFADGRTMRPRVPGTVPYGRSVDPGDESRFGYLREDEGFFRGLDGDGGYLTYMPVAVTSGLILRGKERYNINCAVCHGYLGDGDGTVGERWASPLPSFHDEQYTDRAQRTGKDGYIFEVIREGVVDPAGENLMPAYGHALTEADTWAVVAYLRVLQEARVGAVAAGEGVGGAAVASRSAGGEGGGPSTEDPR